MTKVPPFIGDFSDDDIAWVIRVGVRRHVAAGESIIVEGEEARDVFVVLAGTFRVSSRQLHLPNMKQLGPGELVGEMSFVNKQLPISSVSALEDSEVLCIPRTALSEKIAADAGFQGRFHKVVSEFTVDRLYAWWAPPPPDPPPRDEVVASLRVYELIERMLRGEFLEPPPPPPREPDGNDGRTSRWSSRKKDRPPRGRKEDGPPRKPDGKDDGPRREADGKRDEPPGTD